MMIGLNLILVLAALTLRQLTLRQLSLRQLSETAVVGIIEMFTMFSMQTLSKFSHCFVFVSMLVEYLNFSVIFLQSSK